MDKDKKQELKTSFKEKMKRHAEVVKRLHESYPTIGSAPADDALWRSLTASSARDLNPLTQRRMQEIAMYLYEANPMGHRLLEIVADFVVGDGFTYTAEDDEVLEVINDFWNDPENNLDEEIYKNVLELALFGENAFPIW